MIGHQQVHQHHRENHSQPQAVEGIFHGGHLAAQVDGGTAGQLGLDLLDDLFDAGTDRSQIAAVHVGIDIEDRLHIVMVDDFGRHAAVHASQVGEQLRRADHRAGVAIRHRRLVGRYARSGVAGVGDPRQGSGSVAAEAVLRRADGRAHQRVDGVQAVLRRLHGHEVADAGAPVQPLSGRDLAAAGKRDQQAVAHILLGEAHLAGLLAVHVDIDFRANPPPGECGRRRRRGSALPAARSAGRWA